MGLPPSEVKTMTFWEFLACADAHDRAYGAKRNGGEMTDETYDKLCQLGDRFNAE